MKLVGICRVFKLEEVSEKCAKGQIYFSTKRGEDEKGNPQFETSFINARIVGKAKKQLDDLARHSDAAGRTVPVVSLLILQEIYRRVAGFAPHKICDFAGTPGIT